MTPGPVNLGVCGGSAPVRPPTAAATTPSAASASAPLRADHLPPAPTTPAAPPVTAAYPPTVRGKFLFAGDEKFYVRGVTYGTFRPRADGGEVPEPEVVERDFALMAANGINAIRTYTVPPRWLLDAAQRHRLRAMIGLPVERYIGFLADGSKDAADIEEVVRAGVRACAGHPAVLCYAIGNEIPASVARWFGRRRVERYLERLYRAAKADAPGSLVTYVNYPSTEYLQLDFLDLVCYNVYLETQERLRAYLARLQTHAGERPLVMSEIGLDSRRNGEPVQARTLDWQVRSAFAAGCAGAFVYAWTDEWYRAGADVDDWAFGLTRRNRRPKPALRAVRQAFADVPFAPALAWPRVSVVVCTCNGSRTIRDCLEGLKQLAYPDYEVIVVDDGSTDTTAAVARQYDCRLIRTGNRGLASARNTGLEASTGEIVAYIDDDAYPDPEWLTYLAATFMSTSHAAVGMSSFPITRRSTSPAATWRSGKPASRPSAGSIRSFAPPVMTWTYAGGCSSGAGRSASARPPWSGTTGGIPCAPTGSSRSGTAGPRRCWSASGPRNTTARATSAGPAASTGTGSPARSAGAGRASTTVSGALRRISRSTSPRRACSRRCRRRPSGI